MLKQVIKEAPRLLIIAALSSALLACDGRSLDAVDVSSNSISASLVNDKILELSGTVGDAPIIDARITVKDVAGKLIASTITDDNARYSVTVPSGTFFPLMLTVSGGTNTVTNEAPYFEMISVVDHANQSTANINSFTTLITKSAEAMSGGLNLRNVSLAKLQITNSMSFGLNNETMPDVVTSIVTANNVASFVKASVAVGEWLRRTHTILEGEDGRWSQSNLLTVLSTDLADGMLDGYHEGKIVNTLVAATANVLSAQVLIETLSQTLSVASVDVMASI